MNLNDIFVLKSDFNYLSTLVETITESVESEISSRLESFSANKYQNMLDLAKNNSILSNELENISAIIETLSGGN